MSIQFEYFYGSQAEQFSFYRIPKVLFTDEAFMDISVEAKVLFMLDRMSLSVKNCWFDDDNRVYIIYTIDDILSDFGCARQKALKLLDELEKGIGLIERKRQGLGWMKSLLLWLMLYAVMSRQYASTSRNTLLIKCKQCCHYLKFYIRLCGKTELLLKNIIVEKAIF